MGVLPVRDRREKGHGGGVGGGVGGRRTSRRGRRSRWTSLSQSVPEEEEGRKGKKKVW